ncbi:MAG: GGDEF domain-containing protein [Lachnospiraceae bacterium]|nr:GGDEF domain-containing protein [Lachnospiraceae bacterium]
MKTMYKIKGLICKDSPFEDEANGLLFLMRYFLLLIIPYFLIMTFFCMYERFDFYALAFFASALSYMLVWSLSYHVRPRACMRMIIVVTVLSTCVLTYGFGWRCSFQNLIYITFLMIWYDPASDHRLKFYSSIWITCAVLIISAITPSGNAILDRESLAFTLVFFFNTLLFAICLGLVAYFFCMQYVESEHKLYLYNRKLKAMSETDPLTQLPNRRFTENELHLLERRANRRKHSIAIAIGDIDFFKRVNDTYGHDCGDYVLSTLAGMFKQFMGDYGFVARWGGEEFLFVFEKADGDHALQLLENLQNEIRSFHFSFEGQTFSVTMTFGLEELNAQGSSASTIAAADHKLYQGKEGGRNRVIY